MSVYHLCAVSSQARGGHWIPCNFTTTCVLGSESRSSGKVSGLNHCTISPAPLYLKSSISKSVSVPCCLLTIPGEIQICIIITIDPFLGKNLWIQAGERTPEEKACIAPGGPQFSSRRIYRLRLLQTPALTGT